MMKLYVYAIFLFGCSMLISPTGVQAISLTLEASNSTGISIDRFLDGGTSNQPATPSLFSVGLFNGSTDLGDFDALCFEPGVTIGVGSSHLTSFKPSAYGNNGIYAAWLFDNYFDNTPSATEISGLQIALWEVRKDTPSFNLTSGNLITPSGQYNTGANQIESIRLANIYLTGLSTLLSTSSLTANQIQTLDKKYLIFSDNINQSVGIQDLIVKTGEPVPEPATMLLLGSGLVGLIGAARRKKQA